MKPILVTLLLAACSNSADDTATDAAVSTCTGGGDHFVMTGAIAADSVSFGLVTVNSKVTGIAGAAANTDLIAFSVRSALSADLDALGDHDIATQNIMELRAPFNTSCDTGNTVCHGFFAQAGTLTVAAVHPRYQATFTLSNLFERSDNSGPPGAAIAGAIAGCVDKANP
jgi:hypothetical protein